jgi:alkylation response protein AidB-like acyl-CoA dehydrogenase
VADGALRLFGANGFRRESLVEKLVRDARAGLIEHGSNEVLALVGARRLLAAAAAHEPPHLRPSTTREG